jgi:AraC-like DNA-binding protein
MLETGRHGEMQYWRDTALDGACLATARYTSHEFERHVHDEMVIAVTEAGAGRCRARFGSDISGPETVWIFAPGEYHCGGVWGQQGWSYRGIYLDATGLKALAEIFSDERGGELWAPPGLYHDPQLARMLVQAHECASRPVTHMERQAKWWAALGLLFGRYGRPKPGGAQEGNEPCKMAVARDYIVEHHTQDISIDELAAVCGLSRYHLMRSFAREYGMPPHAYANQLRLAAARKLIVAGQRPADAAAAVGFYDQSHLSRLFKRAYGITPGAYAASQRRSAQGQMRAR